MCIGALLLAGVVAGAVPIQDQGSFGPVRLSVLAESAAKKAVAKFADKGLKDDQIGIAVAALDPAGHTYTAGAYRGAEAMYPASVVKLFYLAYAARLLEDKKLKLTKEFERGIKEMIVESDNDATAYVLDCITGTSGGAELPPAELKRWMDKRQAVNRWYVSMGYQGINVCQKAWEFGPYGRERQGYGPNFELRNSLTPNACVRLMSEILLDRVVNPDRCAWMRSILERPILANGPVEGNSQSTLFTGKVLPKGSKLWSKAGWTDTVRHDVAGIQLPDGRQFVFAIFTKAHSGEGELIPFMATELLKGLGS